MLGIWAPFGEIAGDGPLVCLDILVHGYGFGGFSLTEPHKALIYGDSDEPGGEFGVSLELLELLEGLEEDVLGDVFGVLAVLGDVLGGAEDLALVLADELLEGGGVTGFGAGDEFDVRVRRLGEHVRREAGDEVGEIFFRGWDRSGHTL